MVADTNFKMVVKTFSGLEEVLAKELQEIGVSDARVVRRGVIFRGNNHTMYRANYLCRNALRVLKTIREFHVSDQDELYSRVYKMDWPALMNIHATFRIDASVKNSFTTHSQFVAQRTKDAIADKFRNKYNKRPSVDTYQPDIRIDVMLNNNKCTVSLDSSGDSLHRRGYRTETVKAPINEVLAAGMVRLTGWHGETDFYDPMCGSGTLLIEAAMIAKNIPAGYFRRKWAFQNWPGYDAAEFETLRAEADSHIAPVSVKIAGSDISAGNLQMAKQNVRKAGLSRDIRLFRADMFNSEPPFSPGMLITNPPYDKRMQTTDCEALYRKMGDTLKQHYNGFDAWIISSEFNALKSVGLKTSRKIPLFNGPLECRFNHYQMYKGSKKNKNRDEE